MSASMRSFNICGFHSFTANPAEAFNCALDIILDKPFAGAECLGVFRGGYVCQRDNDLVFAVWQRLYRPDQDAGRAACYGVDHTGYH